MRPFQEELRWPTPQYNENEQPHFLFIITPPYSGSTALSELINSSYRTMIIQEQGEGQWLIPGLCEQDRWEQDKKVDYNSIKAVWLNRFQAIKRLTQNIDVVIEKSPPNMMRIERLASQFRDYSFIANNRNPYAICASVLYRGYDAEKISAEERKMILGKLAKSWLKRSEYIRYLIQKLNIPLLTYEQFCHDPSSILNILHLPDGVSESINPQTRVKVKDYEPQVITNQNERQMLKLTSEELEHISVILEPNQQLLDSFGYQIIRL